jgi:PAS domain S-box-containing protein
MARRPWTFAHRVGLGLAVSLVAALAIGLAALLALSAVRASNEAATRALSTDLLEVERLRRAYSERVAAARGYVITGDARFAQELVLARHNALAVRERLVQRFTDMPGAGLLEELHLAEQEHERALRGLMEARDGGASAEHLEAQFTTQLGRTRTQVLDVLGRLAQDAEQRLALGTRRAQLAERRALWLILLAAGLGVLGVGGLGWVLARKLRPLRLEADATQERLRLLVEGVRDYALVLLDAQGRVVSWNPGAERIKGWKEAEVLGASATMCFPAEVAQGGLIAELLERAAREGQLHVEMWEKRKDGSRFWAAIAVTAMREADGRLKGYSVVSRDITERRRIERMQHLLAEAGRLFHQHLDPDLTVAELARMMVPELADGCILFLRTASGQLKPRAAVHASAEKEALMWELLRRYPPELERTDTGVQEVLRTGRSRRMPEVTPEMMAAAAIDGEQQRMLEALEIHSHLAVPLRVGDVSRGVLVLLSSQPGRHYSEDDQVLVEELVGRAALALDNARLYREAQQALELIGVASHDLGNPLQALQLGLLRLKRLDVAAEPQRVREGLASALRQAEKLKQLLHNLLDLSQQSAGRRRLDGTWVDLGELVREVAEHHAEHAAEAGSALRVEAPPGVVGRWDRLQLERVVTNLLSNALKFGRGRPVELRVEAAEGRARLVVRDQGEGIAPEAQRRIFERFERAQGGGRQAGFGLGLYIVRQLVESHGGTIRVESTQGEGSTFLVELPLAPAELEREGPPPPAPH